MSSNTHFHKLKVKDIRPETAECVSVCFSVPNELQEEFNFLPGQYLTLKTNIDGNEVRRSYSICSSKESNELRVAVKLVEDGKFSGYINQQLRIGDELEVMAPLGKFTPKTLNQKDKKYVAIAAGSGITPIMSIMQSILQSNNNAEFTLIYGNKNQNSIIFKENINALKNKHIEHLRTYHIFSREATDTPLFNGRISKEKIDAFSNKLINLNEADEIFICGPEELILSLRDYLIHDKKIDSHKIHVELFSSPDQPRKNNAEWVKKQEKIDPSKTSQVTVTVDGRSFDMNLAFAGTNILDAALQQGADLPYACKGGVCCTCRAKLVEGEVEMEANYALEPEEVANNFILTCQAHPRSERVVVDFDVK